MVASLSVEARAHAAALAVDRFNRGAFWDAHEALETIWRAVDDEAQALVLQGLIQAAAALLHRERGNRHGVIRVGNAALEKLAGGQHPDVEFETERFRGELERALRDGAPAPNLRLRVM
jgi:predicted metal-dependent hydrolase